MKGLYEWVQVLFVAGGKQIMSADSSGILRLWSLDNGECEMSLEAHEDKVFQKYSSKRD